jgi:hypothetical protein
MNFPSPAFRATIAAISLEAFVALRRVGWLVLLMLAGPVLASAGAPKKCVTTEDATQLVNKDICVSAHIYNIVEMPDGTRFLDI